MKPPLPAVLYGTRLLLAYGAGWFFKPAASPDNASAQSHPAPAKRSGPPIPQKPANASGASGANWLDAAASDIAEIRAAMRAGVVNQVLLEKMTSTFAMADENQRLSRWLCLLPLVRGEDAVSIHGLLVENEREGRIIERGFTTFCTQWGRVSGAVAANTLPPEKSPWRKLKGAILMGWASEDAAAALAWTKEEPERRNLLPSVISSELSAIVKGAASASIDEAEALVLANVNDPDFAEAISEVARMRIARDGFKVASEWFAKTASGSGPDAFKKAGLNALIGAGVTPAKTKLSLEYLSEPWLPEDAGEALGLEWAWGDPAAGVMEMDRMTSSEAREMALSVLLNNWEVESLGAWLNDSRGHTLFDRAAEALVRKIHVSDPEAAKAWAAEIKDPRLRQKTAKLFMPAPLDPFTSE